MEKTEKKLPQVLIFGRANVGKSTLFNRLTESRKALVAPVAGTTRDANRGEVFWGRRNFSLLDSGGIIEPKYLLRSNKGKRDSEIDTEVQKRTASLLQEADLILFLVDAHAGLLPQDKEMALILKKIIPHRKNIILIANKADNLKHRQRLAEFNKLGLSEPIPVSASTGAGTGDLLDIIVDNIKKGILKTKAEEPAEEDEIKNSINVCIVGKPNVGKSSLLNSILGEKRVIVSPVPHTTREPQDTKINFLGQPVILVDTAGISKKGRQKFYRKESFKKEKRAKDYLEKGGIAKSLAALTRADIALLTIDISEDITHQDLGIAEEIISRGNSLMIIANKWDKVAEKDRKAYTDLIYSKFPFARWAPILFVTALTGSGTDKVLPATLEIKNQRSRELSQSQLDNFLSRVVKIHRPAKGKGVKHPRIYKLKQTKSNPPEFEVRIGPREDLHFSYLRFLENRLREKFGFSGTPIRIKITKRQAN